MRCLTYTHQRITLEVSWVPTATPENHIDLVSVHSQMLEVLGGKVFKTRPQLTTLCYSSALLPLYMRFFVSLVRGGALRRLRGRQSGQSTESRAKKDRQIVDEGIILVKVIKLPRTLPLKKN